MGPRNEVSLVFYSLGHMGTGRFPPPPIRPLPQNRVYSLNPCLSSASSSSSSARVRHTSSIKKEKKEKRRSYRISGRNTRVPGDRSQLKFRRKDRRAKNKWKIISCEFSRSLYENIPNLFLMISFFKFQICPRLIIFERIFKRIFFQICPSIV